MNDHGGTILQYQDNQAQTNFWSQFIAEANQLNNTLDGIANGTVNPTNSEIQSLITQVNNYNEFGATFTGSQGGVFGDRFDNELLSGTLKTNSANAVAGLQSVEANGLNATNAAQLVAAGVGFVADANDVAGNNLPTGGGAVSVARRPSPVRPPRALLRSAPQCLCPARLTATTIQQTRQLTDWPIMDMALQTQIRTVTPWGLEREFLSHKTVPDGAMAAATVMAMGVAMAAT